MVVVGRRVLAAHLGDDVKPLRARPLAVDADGSGVAHALHAIDDLLDVGRHHVLAAEDDEVLEPPGHEEESLGVEESEIPGSEPAARHQHLRGGGRVVVVALHHAGTLHADLTLDTRGTLAAALVQRRENLHRDAAARLAHGEKPPARIEPERHPPRPDGDRQGRLGQAVARRDDALEAEVRLERVDRRQAHGLGARERRLEASQIESGRVPDVAHAVAVAEVRRDRERRADLRDQGEPLSRVAEIGRQEPDRRTGERRRERAADQPHVVVERKPRHDAIVDGDPGRLGHEVDGRHHVLVGEHDTARVAGAPRGVLQEAQIVRLRRGERRRRRVDLEIRRFRDHADVRGERAALVHAGAEPADRRDRDRFGVAEDGRRRLDAERGVKRHRHRAQAQGAEERVEEFGARRIDETDPVARRHARPREPGGVLPALRPQASVGDGLVVEPEVLLVGREGRAPAHHLGQRRSGSHVIVDHARLLGDGGSRGYSMRGPSVTDVE